MPIDQQERYSRQADLVPAKKLEKIKATVIGVGAIGRQVALQLAAIGVPWIQLIDFDTVEDGNLAAQGFFEEDLGKTKVEAISNLVYSINSNVSVIPVEDRFRRGMPIGNVVFCCVDRIDIREFVWGAVKDDVKMFIDGRMAAEALRVLVVSDDESAEYYPTTLFDAGEAFQGSCTAKTTIYSSNVVAGVMVAQLAKRLRNMPLDCDIQVNLLTNEITAKDPIDLKREAEQARLAALEAEE
jgi:sulfur carrier protein ThiS adenylyltransferase